MQSNDDLNIRGAVLDTLNLIVEAVQYTITKTYVNTNETIDIDDKFPFYIANDDRSQLLQLLEGNVDSYVGTVVEDEVQSEKKPIYDAALLTEKEQHLNNFGSLEIDDTDYWGETCRLDESDYQETCSNTKVWLSSELISLRKRAAQREKYAEDIRKENQLVRIFPSEILSSLDY